MTYCDIPSAAHDREKFERVHRELMEQALKEKEFEARRRMDYDLAQQIQQQRQFDPIEITKMQRLAELARATQEQRAAGSLRRTQAQVTHWEGEEDRLGKELLDAYDAESRD